MHGTVGDERDLDGAGLATLLEQSRRRIGGLVRIWVERLALHVRGTSAEPVRHVQGAG
jgi:hypothetical protein